MYIPESLLDIIAFKRICNSPVEDFDSYICAPTWTLEEGITLLATFKAKTLNNETIDDDILESCGKYIEKILYKTLVTYEMENKTFLIGINYENNPNDPSKISFNYDESEIFPDAFINWARDMSLPVPDEFYQKLMRAQERHSLREKGYGVQDSDPLTAKERRELGRLRREKENFDLAIKATVRAVQHCIKVDRRVIRAELFDLLTRGEDKITKEMFDRIVPLLPQEYRETSGAPSSCKIGDSSEPEK